MYKPALSVGIRPMFLLTVALPARECDPFTDVTEVAGVHASHRGSGIRNRAAG